MIHTVIFTAPGGKIVLRKIYGWQKYFVGVKIKGVRPHLVQIFGDYFDEQDKKDIFTRLRFCKHPQHGRIMINGEFVTKNTIL